MTSRPPDPALELDLYQLTMAQTYLRAGMTAGATFDLFVRTLPNHRSFLVVAGIEPALEFLETFAFDDQAIATLRAQGIFREETLRQLGRTRFTGQVWALPEGELAFAGEPILRVTAPMVEAQLVETWLLSCVTFQSLIATKAARLSLACGGRPFVEFGLRRAHGPEAGFAAARAAFVGGAEGTSNVAAAARYGIPASGTMAHSFITAFDDEEAAFEAYARDHGSRTTLLVDTYDTVEGARRAARVGQRMRERGEELAGVRLDSGDPAELARRVRRVLDEAGLTRTRIFLSGDLDEHVIARLLEAGAPIDAFGVGTQLVTSADAPALGGVYKLAEYAGKPRMKLSRDKVTLPGRKQVFRMKEGGRMARDVIALEGERVDGAWPLLQEVMRFGLRIRPQEPLEDCRARLRRRLDQLPEPLRDLDATASYPVALSPGLEALTRRLARDLRAREHLEAAPSHPR